VGRVIKGWAQRKRVGWHGAGSRLGDISMGYAPQGDPLPQNGRDDLTDHFDDRESEMRTRGSETGR